MIELVPVWKQEFDKWFRRLYRYSPDPARAKEKAERWLKEALEGPVTESNVKQAIDLVKQKVRGK